MLQFSKNNVRWTVVKIVSIYAVISCLWIYLSDTTIWQLTQNQVILTRISIVKGFVFILISSILLYRFFARYALQMNEYNYQLKTQASMLESMAEGVSLCNEDGTISYSNQAFENMFGYDKGELIGKHITILNNKTDEENKQFYMDIIARLSREKIVTSEFENRKKDGSVIYTLAHICPIEVAGKRNWITVQDDITQQKQAEEKLRLSEERLSLAQRSSGTGIWDWDIVNSRLAWSRELFELFGLDPEKSEASFETWNNVLHPDDREVVSKLIEKTLKDGKVLRNEFRIIRPDGKIRWIRVIWRALYSPEGRPIRMAGICLNVTKRKMYENNLLKSEERFKTLASATFEGIAITERGRFVDVNEQLASMLGYKHDELINLSVEAVIAPEDRACVMANIMDGRESDIECRILCKDGSQRIVEARGKVIERGGVQLRVSAIHDITERKRGEVELRRAKEAAESATQAKSQFLANMSHELRTPMTGLLGMLRLALEEDLAPVPRSYLETALRSAHSLLHILNDILDMAKIEAGKLTIIEKPFSLKRCVTDIIDVIAPEVQRKGIDFAHSISDEVPDTVTGDQLRLQQILINLIGNAVKFTEVGKVELRITASEMTTGRKRAFTFTVTDTGIGIPNDKKELLFQAFSQVDASHTRSYGGTGLGLAISREIVGLMGGTINFVSEEGVGSIFSFTIPLAEARLEDDDLPESESLSPETTSPVGEEERISHLLLAEDDRTIREFFGAILKRANYTFDVAEDGLEAVEMWEKGKYDLVLMDVQMPRLNGIEATRAIREKERERGGHTPIVAVTGHAHKEDEMMRLAAGMDAFISKPINLRKCLQVIREFIGLKPSGGN